MGIWHGRVVVASQRSEAPDVETSMRWRSVACVLWLAGLTGCPHAFGRGGTIDRAVAKDVKESLEQLPVCTAELRRRLCPDGQERSEECLRICADELEALEDG